MQFIKVMSIACLSFVFALSIGRTVYADPATIVIDAETVEGIVKPFLGVNAGPYKFGEPENTHVSEQYRDLGINMVRTHGFQGPLDFKTIYPDTHADPNDPASFDFKSSDLAARMIHDNGHEIYFRIGNSPNYEGTPPEDIPNFIEATMNIIRHYMEGLWDGYEFPIRYVEIWNEPKNQEFWTGTPAEFLDFYTQMAVALKAEFPDLLFGGPAFLPSGYFIQEFPEAFVSHMQNNNVPLDFLSWHMYNDDPTVFSEAARYYRQLLDDHGFTEAESHITEWNTGESPLRYNAAGAAIMTSVWINLQNSPTEVSIIHRGQDPSIDYPEFYGILYADGSYKKIAYAFQGWSRLVEDYPKKVAVSDDGDMVEALAALSDDQNSLAILLSHYTQRTSNDSGMAINESDGKDGYQLNITGWPVEGPIHVQRYIVSDSFSLNIVEDQVYSSLSEFTSQIQHFPDDMIEFVFLTSEATSSVNKWESY